MDYGYFPSAEVINIKAAEIKADANFHGTAMNAERSYRANRMGFIDRSFLKGNSWWDESGISTEDEYKFARKYFHSSRIWIAFFMRIATFHNPVREFSAIVKSTTIKRVKPEKGAFFETGFAMFTSELLKSAPLISVVIPTLNRYPFLESVLNDFEKQEYKNFEIVIVDQSDPYQPDFYKKFNLNIKLLRQEEKALWLARNTAIREAKGTWIALSEDDVRIPPDWLSNHLKCIDFFKSDISAGVFFPEGGKIPDDRNFFRWADQFATGNACLKKEVFQKIGLFDRQFEKQRMGDGEFGLRAYLAGFKSVSNPYSWCEDVKADTGGLRQSGSWDAYRPKSFWSPRPVPSVLYLYRKYFGLRATLLSLIYNLPPSVVPYRFKRNKSAVIAGSLIAIALLPIIFIQVIRSWRISSDMLKKPMIGKINE